MTIGDYPRNRGATVFSFLIREKMLDAEEIVKKLFPLPLRKKHEMCDYLCWPQPWMALSLEQRAHIQELLALLSTSSTARTWAVKGRGRGGKGEGKRILHLNKGKVLVLGAEHWEFMQSSVCQPLSVSSPQVSRIFLPFNSPLVHLLI